MVELGLFLLPAVKAHFVGTQLTAYIGDLCAALGQAERAGNPFFSASRTFHVLASELRSEKGG